MIDIAVVVKLRASKPLFNHQGIASLLGKELNLIHFTDLSKYIKRFNIISSFGLKQWFSTEIIMIDSSDRKLSTEKHSIKQ